MIGTQAHEPNDATEHEGGKDTDLGPAGASGPLLPRIFGYGAVAAVLALLAYQWAGAVNAGAAAAHRTAEAARRADEATGKAQAPGGGEGTPADGEGTPADGEGTPCASLTPRVVSKRAPDFSLADLAGRAHRLSSLRGRAVLLHFWFTRCPPCVEELPSLLALHRTLRKAGDPITLLTVSVDEEPAEVKRFLGQHRLTELQVLTDPARKVSAAFGTAKFPETYLILPDGTVRLHFVNKRDWSSPAARSCLLSALGTGSKKDSKTRSKKDSKTRSKKGTPAG